ncbi:MAG: histidine kinase, partial [Clostridiales bacterium]|nr:histidine kinase [Clostridiales bacterium]
MRKRRSLNRTIFIIVSISYIALLVLLLSLNYYLIYAYQKNNREREETALESYVEQISENMDKTRRVIYDIYMENEDFEALTGDLSEVEWYSHSYDLCGTLEGQMLIDGELQGFYLINRNGDLHRYKVNTESVPSDHARHICEALLSLQSLNEEEQPSGWFSLTIDEDLYILTCYQKGNVALYGLLTLGDGEEILEEQLQKTVDMLLISDGTIVCGQQPEDGLNIQKELGSAKSYYFHRGLNYVVYARRLPDMNVWICPVLKHGLADYVTIQHILLLMLTVVSAAMAVYLTFYLRSNMVKPLIRLRNEMEKIRKGECRNIPDMETRFLELQEVTETLQTMIAQIENQRLQIYDAVIEKQKAQLQYLQIQLQPHFYLNSLKVLNALTISNQKEKAQALILRLSDHMRYLMQVERESTTLENEVEFVRNYVELLMQMSGRKIEINIDIDPETLQWEVPVLVIQTFVENSFKYAKLGDVNYVLLLQISVNRLNTEEGDFLDIQVSDNGQGYPETVLEDVSLEPRNGDMHIGINNLRRRCRLL